MKRLFVYGGLVLACVCAMPVMAQVNPKVAQYADEIEMVRSLQQVERKAAVERNMQFTPDEAVKFWPLYNEYEAERLKVNNQLVKLITDYAASFESLDEKTATQLRNGYFDLQSDMISLRKKHARKMGKALTQVKVTRFFQLEQKMDAVMNLSLARQIPLVH
jgi:hypothetical protein